jgi:hypothetical protein
MRHAVRILPLAIGSLTSAMCLLAGFCGLVTAPHRGPLLPSHSFPTVLVAIAQLTRGNQHVSEVLRAMGVTHLVANMG